MLSRVANSIYWMNRYVERAENYARFIGVNFNLILELPPGEQAQWAPLLQASGDNLLFQRYFEEPERQHVLRFMSFDERNPNAILNCLYRARENARSIREIISREMWEHLNQFYLKCRDAATRERWKMSDWQDFYTMIKLDSQLFFGIIDSTITRGEGWHFGCLGRLTERADKTSRFVDVKYFILMPEYNSVGSNLDVLQWTAVLKSVSAYNMYRQAYRLINPSNIIEFLILHQEFPRSIMYCLRHAEQSLHAIAGDGSVHHLPNKLMGKLRADLEYNEVSDIFRVGLHEFLDGFQMRLNQLGDAIYETYFALKTVEEASQSQWQQ